MQELCVAILSMMCTELILQRYIMRFRMEKTENDDEINNRVSLICTLWALWDKFC